MIKANELRIGNLINYGYKVAIVNAIREDGGLNVKLENTLLGAEFECFKPIPLTPEILENVGFINRDSYWHSKDFSMFLEGDYYFQYISTPTSNGFLKVNYLHQLQNLYFALTNEELEINL